jgi:hypothetical protein
MSKFLKCLAVIAAMAMMATTANAAPMTFWSGDGGDNLVSSINGNTGAVTTITPHPVWGDVSTDVGLAADSVDWISYADTGIGGFIAPNVVGPRDPGNETMHVQRLFSIADGTAITLSVLADDTAAVRLTGPGGLVEFFPASNAQLDPCSGQTIGCAGQHKGVFNWTNLQGGLYTLDLYQFQTNGDVSGMQFAGTYESVPEPATMTLLAAGLFGAAFTMRRRRSRG